MFLIRLSGMEAPYVEPGVSIFDTLSYRGKARDVAIVISDGEVVMRDGQSTRVSGRMCKSDWQNNFPDPWTPRP